MPSKGMDYLLRLVQLRALLSLSANRSFICSSFCSYNGANIRNILKYRLFTSRLLQKNRKTRCVPRFSITPTPAGFTVLNGIYRWSGPVNDPYPAWSCRWWFSHISVWSWYFCVPAFCWPFQSERPATGRLTLQMSDVQRAWSNRLQSLPAGLSFSKTGSSNNNFWQGKQSRPATRGGGISLPTLARRATTVPGTACPFSAVRR